MSKILLITNIYPPQIGGPSTFINQFARFLAGKGHRVTVVCVSANLVFIGLAYVLRAQGTTIVIGALATAAILFVTIIF